MGIVTEYFAAATDEAAAEALRVPGGPCTPADGSLPRFDAVTLPSLDPFVMLAGLAQALSGRPYGEITADPRHGALVGSNGDEGPWIVTVTEDLTKDLASVAPARLARVTRDWIRETEPPVPAHRLTSAVLLLAELATRAVADGRGLYCWTSLGAEP
ncbi:hypothetical protein [Myceligenerans pegani]|uniref:SUKH-4 immunity protein of toxin-antitoxin system n=1 Tax=Myceligenerans pegani TaxID=2776917 RepID=A0ABR9MUQ9_9MICO|nr:hypothetical protein [Myceligenerans sp. TRM 65318]MBE1874674.1 hypothetical protein [Myceligenerans sp. TRM 65318]MBE3016945.1 hypothetical protein [Myceligenerans sp. TRM 65318]